VVSNDERDLHGHALSDHVPSGRALSDRVWNGLLLKLLLQVTVEDCLRTSF
jgi:hypothetical protein